MYTREALYEEMTHAVRSLGIGCDGRHFKCLLMLGGSFANLYPSEEELAPEVLDDAPIVIDDLLSIFERSVLEDRGVLRTEELLDARPPRPVSAAMLSIEIQLLRQLLLSRLGY